MIDTKKDTGNLAWSANRRQSRGFEVAQEPVAGSEAVPCIDCYDGQVLRQTWPAGASEFERLERIQCPTCHGTGRVAEPETVECPECKGSGWASFEPWPDGVVCKVTCGNCSGTGRVAKPETDVCPQCSGNGFVGREVDDDGKLIKNCATCHGTGRVDRGEGVA